MLCAVAATQIAGCASAPAPRSESPAAAKAGDTTQFDEQILDETQDDDFWDTGATASVDDDGRLVYLVPTTIVEDGNLNDAERRGYESTTTPYYYLDPVTGMPVRAPVGAWRGPDRARSRTSGTTVSSQSSGYQRGAVSGNRLPTSTPRVSPPLDRSAPMQRNRR